MPYCAYCGSVTKDTDNFCGRCGKTVIKPLNNNETVADEKENVILVPKPMDPWNVEKYEPRERVFFMDDNIVITVSEGLDSFNYFRKIFADYARKEVNLFKDEYLRNIQNIDAFLMQFERMYIRYRAPLLMSVVDLFPQYGIYDISIERFAEFHGNTFCLIAEDVKVIIDSLNMTAQANQQRKINNYNMMPGFIFGGLGGLIAATAVNVAVSSIAQADINNLSVTPTQKMEIFSRINFHHLFERVYLDYWRVFLSLAFQLKNHGTDMWYPNNDVTNECKGIYQNILGGRMPEDKLCPAIGYILQNEPYNLDYYKFYISKYGKTDSIQSLADYFGVAI